MWKAFKGLIIASSVILGVAGVLAFGFHLGLIGLSLLALPPSAIGLSITAASALSREDHRIKSRADLASTFNYYIDQWRGVTQDSISQVTKDVVNAGVSQLGGLYGVLKQDNYFRVQTTDNQAEIVHTVSEILTITMMTAILKIQGAFVTIGSDKCDSKGPNGAWDGDDVLSFCSSNGTMFNIIRAGHHNVHNHWVNAGLIFERYNITVEYLTQQSYDCQLHHGPNYDAYLDGHFPQNSTAECVANFPVCDLRKPELAKAKKEHNTIHACRKIAKLPI